MINKKIKKALHKDGLWTEPIGAIAPGHMTARGLKLRMAQCEVNEVGTV